MSVKRERATGEMGVSLIWKKQNRGEKIWRKKGTHTRGRHWIWSRCVHHTSAMIHTINIGLTHERQSNSPRRRRRRFCRKVFYVTVRLWLACCEKLVLHLILNTKACFHFPSLSPLVPYIAKQCFKKKINKNSFARCVQLRTAVNSSGQEDEWVAHRAPHMYT